MQLRLRETTLELSPRAPLIMGIVNIGVDSVADPRALPTLDAQLEFAMRQYHDGAHIIDIGVQSGRTDTPTLAEERECEQLTPLVAALAREGVPVSVDVWRHGVVAAALAAGAALINDVSGLADERLADLAAESGAALVVMHTRAAPKVEHFPGYDDPFADVLRFLEERLRRAERRGVERSQLILDPGLDFAKTPHESIAVLRRLPELAQLERPVLLAVSRKYFIGMLTAAPPDERLAGTLAAVAFGVAAGSHIVRVHDVAAVAEFLRVRSALLDDDGEPELLGDPALDSLKWLPPRADPADPAAADPAAATGGARTPRG